MGIIDRDDICGYRDGTSILCPDCFRGDEDELDESDFIMRSEINRSGDVYRCNLCGKTLSKRR